MLAEEEAPARVVERFSASDEVWRPRRLGLGERRGRLLMHRAQTTYKTPMGLENRLV